MDKDNVANLTDQISALLDQADLRDALSSLVTVLAETLCQTSGGEFDETLMTRTTEALRTAYVWFNADETATLTTH